MDFESGPEALVLAKIDCGVGQHVFDEVNPGPKSFVSAEMTKLIVDLYNMYLTK